jgi:tetratricopeptide (TPR) repeat protein
MARSWEERIREDVIRFEQETFRLRDELRRLDDVRSIGAIDATIFYSSRILEAVCRFAVEAIGRRPTTNVFANLLCLWKLRLVSPATGYLGHALRRLGNATRHMLRHMDGTDANVSIALAEHWLGWYFCEGPTTPCYGFITRDKRPLGLTPNKKLNNVVSKVAALDFEGWAPEPVGSFDDYERRGFLESSIFPALNAEMLLDFGHMTEANCVLDHGLRRFPDDLRLLQLRALWHSRKSQTEAALELLEPLIERSPVDPETSGITGGVYKRIWKRTKNRRHLKTALTYYDKGWRAMKMADPYSGINVAAIHLWLGAPELSRAVAHRVRDIVRSWLVAPSKPKPTDLAGELDSLHRWDLASLAEAELLTENHEEAKRIYAVALKRYAGDRKPNAQQDYLRIVSEQAGRHLDILGDPVGIRKLLP